MELLQAIANSVYFFFPVAAKYWCFRRRFCLVCKQMVRGRGFPCRRLLQNNPKDYQSHIQDPSQKVNNSTGAVTTLTSRRESTQHLSSKTMRKACTQVCKWLFPCVMEEGDLVGAVNKFVIPLDACDVLLAI